MTDENNAAVAEDNAAQTVEAKEVDSAFVVEDVTLPSDEVHDDDSADEDDDDESFFDEEEESSGEDDDSSADAAPADEEATPSEAKTQADTEETQSENPTELEELERQLAENKRLLAEYRENLKDYGFEGEDRDIIDSMEAHRKGVDVEELRKERLQAEQTFAGDLAAIKKEFPQEKAGHIKDLGEAYFNLMKSGNISAVDAYKSTHLDEIIAQREAAARQKALNEVSSKKHLKQNTGSSTASMPVPPAVYQKYKELMPELSDAEIRRHYAKSKDD